VGWIIQEIKMQLLPVGKVTFSVIQNKYNHVAQTLVSFSREKKKACIWLDKCASFLFHFLPTDLA
jgi:hypothetical protein